MYKNLNINLLLINHCLILGFLNKKHCWNRDFRPNPLPLGLSVRGIKA